MASNRASARRARSGRPYSFMPPRKAMRQAARLPLSTVEIYLGESPCSVRVSYQLKRWPCHLGRASTVVSMRSISRMTPPCSAMPRSRAAMAETRARPMLVGEVRRATPRGGCSCQLSGGRKWSDSVQNVSKYCHISRERAIRYC